MRFFQSLQALTSYLVFSSWTELLDTLAPLGPYRPHAAEGITQFLDRELAESGLSVAQLGLMAQIAAAGDDTLGALASQIIDDLEV